MRITDTLIQFIKTNCLIKQGDLILVGVSGGADSVFLICALNLLRHKLGIRLHMAHLNHNLRPSAGHDQKFVEHLSKMLNIPLSTAKLKNKSSQRRSEEWARNKRFEFFILLAKKLHANSVALAHTQDDLAETTLMRIIRGSGLKGLRAILPQRNIQNTIFIRPLLNTKRTDIEKFLKKEGITFCTDPSNKDTKFFRNKIRHQLIPLLEKSYNKNIKETLGHLSESITLDYDYLDMLGRNILAKSLVKKTKTSNQLLLNLKSISQLHPAMRHTVLRLGIKNIKGNMNALTFTHMQAIDNLIFSSTTNGILHLPNQLSVYKHQKILKISIK